MTSSTAQNPVFRNLPTTGVTLADIAASLDYLRARVQFRVPVGAYLLNGKRLLFAPASTQSPSDARLDEATAWTVTPGRLTAPDGSHRQLVGTRLDRASIIAKTIHAATPPSQGNPKVGQPNTEVVPLRVAGEVPDATRGGQAVTAEQPEAVARQRAQTEVAPRSGMPRAVRVMAPRQVMRRYDAGWGVQWHEALSLIDRDPASRRQLEAYRADLRAHRAVAPILVDRSEGVVLDGVLRLAAAALEGVATVAVMDHSVIGALLGETAPTRSPHPEHDPREARTGGTRPGSSSWLETYVSQ